ncbi:DUF952 domain-containing protein [Calidithermus chliarophilus]|uniref:DUF952 domain-containing protein n=1 Tax=Calidithermus chliarophilus TaxID=52023 RepID=UPI0004120DFE|nr:DUF952 domain-containing protein [Calidithermus chliarophilus]
MKLTRTIFHITTRREWERALGQREYRAQSLEREGFIHCSTPSQILAVAEAFFSGHRGLVLLCIDPAKLTSPLFYEGPEDYSYGYFPHIYGPVNLEAVTAVLPFDPGPDGRFHLPEGVPK